MKLHEYQSRQILLDYGIPVSNARAVARAEDAAGAFNAVANPGAVAKVQVLMGGRGKSGGVKLIKTAAEAQAFAAGFLGKPFSTYQSPEPKLVKTVLIAEDIAIEKEYYLGLVIDRASRCPVLLFSKEGGVDIEEVARTHPDAIRKLRFAPDAPPSEPAVRAEIQKTGLPEPTAAAIAAIAVRLIRLFVERDASIVEINPLVRSKTGAVLALDAKIVFDDNALFRQAANAALKDPDEEDARERQAKEFGLSYVSMSGNIGCLVNGAGLAMATMDVIKLSGGEPANFLDVGGGATADQVREAFKLIVQDERVEAILVNIFGGIMKCDVIAEGVIGASREISLKVPLVVRLEGTRVEEGRALLKNSGLKIISCDTIDEAAQASVREAALYRKSHGHSH